MRFMVNLALYRWRPKKDQNGVIVFFLVDVTDNHLEIDNNSGLSLYDKISV